MTSLVLVSWKVGLGIGCLGLVLVWCIKAETHHSTVPRVYMMMGQIEKAMGIYAMKHNGKLPASSDELLQFASTNYDYIEQPLLKKENLIDPWGKPFEYVSLGGRKYILRSSGPDKIMGTEDDKYSGFSVIPPSAERPKVITSVDGQNTNAWQVIISEQLNRVLTDEDRAREEEELSRIRQQLEEARQSVLGNVKKTGGALILLVLLGGVVIAWRYVRKRRRLKTGN